MLPDSGVFPNHPQWPLLIYPSAVELSPDQPAVSIDNRFSRNDWGGLWRNGIFTFQHYHSNAHEALGIFMGTARVQFGGPQGVEIELQAGDVAVLPAGTAHKNLGNSANFGVVGAYPAGAAYDLCRGKKQERTEAIEANKRVAKPATDPVYGVNGGLLVHWSV